MGRVGYGLDGQRDSILLVSMLRLCEVLVFLSQSYLGENLVHLFMPFDYLIRDFFFS